MGKRRCHQSILHRCRDLVQAILDVLWTDDLHDLSQSQKRHSTNAAAVSHPCTPETVSRLRMASLFGGAGTASQPAPALPAAPTALAVYWKTEMDTAPEESK